MGLAPHSMWEPPGLGIEPLSPALTGGFFTTKPPGETKRYLVPWVCLTSKVLAPDHYVLPSPEFLHVVSISIHNLLMIRERP